MDARREFRRLRHTAVPAPFVLPAAGTVLLVISAVAGSTHLPASVVIGLCAGAGALASAVGEPLAAVPIGLLSWMTATAFSAQPYGTLRLTGSVSEPAFVSCVAAAGLTATVGWTLRRRIADRRRTLDDMETLPAVPSFRGAVDRRRMTLGVALAVVVLPLLTTTLAAHRRHFSLTDDLLFYLSAVVAIAVVGGFWPAVTSAVLASLLLNWYFTPPLHTFTIGEADNLIALVLFVVVAISVSSVVHLAARRAQLAAHSNREANVLLELAKTALGTDDTPSAILRYLQDTLGVDVDLVELAGHTWVVIATSSAVRPTAEAGVVHRVQLRPDLQLAVRGATPSASRRLLEAAGGQLAAALDRDRFRMQASQAEALAAGNRMRTALLTAVSHDLRTPLASIKASVSSLRQTEVAFSPEDESAFLETIEESTDRLGALIANLLDMSRVQTGALQPYLQPAAVEEIAPVALRGLAGADDVTLDLPEDLPLILTDAGLLERVLANLLGNAIRWSPPGQAPVLVARHLGERVAIAVIDRGPGVAADERDRMFEPFQRLGDQDSTTGIGLGLAVARGFTEAIGGTLTATDTDGGGLTMTVLLPAAPATAAVEQSRS
ncbi:MAG: two-component system, OmpR family, sensor histidine kinase KdpD [Frankiaceae bacterium]|nr:two-component system, OmpR family, sensor histidine kinase KdpD [Frankiaceae bacterium]